jgi:hypothetical protein
VVLFFSNPVMLLQVALSDADTSIEQVFVSLEPLHQYAPVFQQKRKNSDSDNDEQRELSPALHVGWYC